MDDQATRPYHANDLSFDLPTALRDKTMHMFTLSDQGASEFSLVISHADTQPEEELDDFSSRLVQEMGRALPKFQLRHSKETLLDGGPAIDLAYSWRKDGIFMHQRQVIALMRGTAPGSTQAIMIAATCLASFGDDWNATFDRLLASVRLRRPLAAAGADSAANVPDAAAGPTAPFIFALSERRRMLNVFADRDEACRKTDAREVEQEAWTFFDADGEALQAQFVVPNSGTLWRKAGSYLLASPETAGATPLTACLPQGVVLQALAPALPFASIEEVRAYLLARAGEGAALSGAALSGAALPGPLNRHG
ncbi:DcrB-related protein [Massilia pseudoviolaceinigra]|uniref:DcrB-related protein n=1 Tax=Massilia pseudoviolaceinigra TaxID=3057165 RepID=UPI0027966354|nr:DcrB-related protein [Massilia sp. CCM 9206]MDQ1920064.1 DcrB-related protein [Massilia sp. CCM 9206]